MFYYIIINYLNECYVISHKWGNWKFDGSGFSTSKVHRGGSLGVLHKRKNLEFGGSVFGDNRGNKGGRLELSHKRKNFEIGGSVLKVISEMRNTH
jgi:hypothetical protein